MSSGDVRSIKMLPQKNLTTCLHSVLWVCTSRVPSTELPARSGGQLSGVSICVGSSWLPSSASCWHVAQCISKAAPSPIFVRRDKRGSIPTSEPPVARLIVSIQVAGKRGMRAGAGLLVPWFVASAFPRPRQTQSITQAAEVYQRRPNEVRSRRGNKPTCRCEQA